MGFNKNTRPTTAVARRRPVAAVSAVLSLCRCVHTVTAGTPATAEGGADLSNADCILCLSWRDSAAAAANLVAQSSPPRRSSLDLPLPGAPRSEPPPPPRRSSLSPPPPRRSSLRPPPPRRSSLRPPPPQRSSLRPPPPRRSSLRPPPPRRSSLRPPLPGAPR